MRVIVIMLCEFWIELVLEIYKHSGSIKLDLGNDTVIIIFIIIKLFHLHFDKSGPELVLQIEVLYLVFHIHHSKFSNELPFLARIIDTSI